MADDLLAKISKIDEQIVYYYNVGKDNLVGQLQQIKNDLIASHQEQQVKENFKKIQEAPLSYIAIDTDPNSEWYAERTKKK